MTDWSEIHADAKNVYEFRLAAVERKVDVMEKRYDQIAANITRILVSVIVSGFSVVLTVIVTHFMTITETGVR
jgi:hypothetical protein